MPESAFDRALCWILDKLEETKAACSQKAGQGDSDNFVRDDAVPLTFSQLRSDSKAILGAYLRNTGIAILMFYFYVGLFGLILIGVRALEVGEYDGQQWTKTAVLSFEIIVYVSAIASPLCGLLALYGPFLAKISRRNLPACLESWDLDPTFLLVALLWAVPFSCLVSIVASGTACALAHSCGWPSACAQLFCHNLHLSELAPAAASFAAAAAFYVHGLSWWHGCVIPLPGPRCRWPMLQSLSSMGILSGGFSVGLPILFGFCFLYIYQHERPLEHFAFVVACLASVHFAGKSARLCAQKTQSLQAWQKVLASVISFSFFGVTVAIVRMMSVNQGMPQMNPPSMLAVCLTDNNGACSAIPQRTSRTAQHARFFLLATTAFPACCGLAWEALRPDFVKAVASGERDWLSRLLVLAVAGAVGSLWAFSTFHRQSDPLAADILFFLLIGLLSCYFLRQLHWRAYFWQKFRRDPATAENPNGKFIVAEFDSAARPALRRHRVSQPAPVAGTRANVLHLHKPLQGWPSLCDIPSRIEAVTMSMQCTVAPFYYSSSWRLSMSELSRNCNNVPFLSHGDVVFLAGMSLAFLIGKVCLLLFVMLAPIHASDAYVKYNATQDVVEDLYDHARTVRGRVEVSAEDYGFGFVRIVLLWWLGNSELYRDLFIAVATACSALAACWRWTGLFSLLDSCLHALALFVITDAEVRKVIILRDAEMAAQCWFVAGIASWLQRTVLFFFAYGWPAVIQARNLKRACRHMKGHVVLYDLLTKSLIPAPADVLMVSAANLPYSMQQNDCIMDLQIFQFIAASATTIATLLAAPGAASMSDVVAFIGQAVLKLKGPLDAYALRLNRIGTIAKALSESSPIDYDPMVFDDAETRPKMHYFSDMPAFWCDKLRFYEVISAANVPLFQATTAQDQHSKKRLTSASLGAGEEVHIDIGQEKVWVTSRLMRRRLAVSVQYTEPDLWAFWTLEVKGLRTCYRTVSGTESLCMLILWTQHG